MQKHIYRSELLTAFSHRFNTRFIISFKGGDHKAGLPAAQHNAIAGLTVYQWLMHSFFLFFPERDAFLKRFCQSTPPGTRRKYYALKAVSLTFVLPILVLILCSLPKAQAQTPANDNCANAVTLASGTSCTTTSGTTVGATQSLPAITCDGSTGTANDVWYKFIAVVATHTVTVVSGNSIDAVIDIRSGDCNGTTIACADKTIKGGTEILDLSGLTIGSTYYVRVYSKTQLQGTFTICVTPTPPPNDNCSNAIAVTLTSGTSCTTTSGTTVGATQSFPAVTCGGTAGTADDDVWYKFTAVTTIQTVTVVGGTGFNAVVGVKSGGCNGSNIACADATSSGGTEVVNLSGLTIGSTYYVRVYSFGSTLSDQGTFSICITHVNPPSNDNCANATTLTSSTSCSGTTGTTAGATQSLAAITCGGTTGTADDDVWYEFTAVAATHTVTVVGDAGFNAVVDVRSADCSGSNIACADATSSGGTETVNLSGLTIGSNYKVRVYSFGSALSDRGTFSICVIYIPPSNDECANAILLTSGSFCSPTNGMTGGATQSLAAITCGGATGTADDDVWYKFTAVKAEHNVTVIGNGNFDAIVDVRSGACNGTNIACADATYDGGTETVNLSGLTIGNTYYVRVYSYSNSNRGTFTICMSNNDDCAGAFTLNSRTSCTPTTGTTVGTTQSLAASACGGSADDDVWYKFTAVRTEHTVTVVGNGNFDAIVDVRSGACNGTNIACALGLFNDEPATANLSDLTIGTTYYVRVYSQGNTSSDQGEFTICVTHNGPANDECANAIALTPGNSCTPTAGTTVGATQSPAAIACGGPVEDDVWYKFTAVDTGHTIKVVGGAGFDVVIDVRSGDCNGTNIACADITGNGETEIMNLPNLTIGSTYYVRLYSFASGVRGTFTICVTPIIPPVNDNCVNAIALTPTTTNTYTVGTTGGATQSLAAITCGANTGTADDDVWYKFTAVAANHTVWVSALANFDVVLDVRSGNCNGATIACSDTTGSGRAEAVNLSGLTIGNTYYIRIYSRGGSASNWGEFLIYVLYTAPGNNGCVNAITLTSDPSCTGTTGTTGGAAESLTAITCAGRIGTADDDVWYKFTAVAAAHTVTVVGGAGFDAVVDVRSGDCNTSANIACADATLGGGTETVNLASLTIGNTYYIRIYSYGSTAANRGTFTICITHIGPANDNCVNAFTLTSGNTCTATAGTTVNAMQSLAAIACEGNTGTADDDVWYKFTAVTAAHTVTVVGGAGFDAVVDVRSGDCNSSANIACAGATSAGGTETVNLTSLTIGSIYYIRIYSYGSTVADRGTFTICVTHTCPADLLVTQPITSGAVVKEAGKITATNQVSGGTVTYQGAQSVTLEPGFSAITGAGILFQAMIGGCL